MADDLARMPQDSGSLIALVFLADAAARVSHRGAITILTEVLAPIADRFATLAGPDVSLGSVASYVGVMAAACGDRDAARGWFEQACALEERFGDTRSLEQSRALLAAAS
jgi:hypothetical protein